MSHASSHDDELQTLIQQSLQEIALQMNHPIDQTIATQLCQEATELLSHLSFAPLTLARVAGTLLVYRVQKGIAPEEREWFTAQVQQCPNEEEVEELIESIHRTDAL
ncbi:MAG: hypothetical protein HC827_12980 [Cyanobacteria bacterium RM1_2_2]|nr:hypothetical protein [Cyanobacteria bacterium RM1_2_2]